MLVKTIPVGQLETNCYVVTNEETLGCVVIDPGDESNTILDYLEDNRLRCEAIFLTHGHYDHVGAVEAVMEETGAPVYLCPRDDAHSTGDTHYSYLLPEGGERTADDNGVFHEKTHLQYSYKPAFPFNPGDNRIIIDLDKVQTVIINGDAIYQK